jgi:hypothetical protein
MSHCSTGTESPNYRPTAFSLQAGGALVDQIVAMVIVAGALMVMAGAA